MTTILTREKLYTDMWTTPIGQLARRLRITSARLWDACKAMQLPLPPLRHWNVQKAGNNPIATPLPSHEGPCEVRIGPREALNAAKTISAATTPAQAAQPRLVPLTVWAAMVFGELAPHSNTLLRRAHDGRFQPPARKIARIWWVTPNAEYLEDKRRSKLRSKEKGQ